MAHSGRTWRRAGIQRSVCPQLLLIIVTEDEDKAKSFAKYLTLELLLSELRPIVIGYAIIASRALLVVAL